METQLPAPVTVLPSQVIVIDAAHLYIDWFGLVKDIIHVTIAP